MHRNLDLATLRTLIAVAETGGMTKAANQLHLTQSTVSMQMKRLEEQLDIVVLERDGRVIKPTEQGSQLIDYARRLLAVNDSAIDKIMQPRHQGALSFGVPFDIVQPHVPSILKYFVQSYPDVSVSISAELTYKLLEDFNAGKHDVILTTEEEPRPGGICLLKQPLVWNGAINGRAWKQRPLPLTFSRTCIFRDPAIQALKAAGIDWVEAVCSNSSFNASSVAGAADLGVRADIKGFSAAGMEAIEDASSMLPPLPEYSVVMYVTDGPNKTIASIFANLMREGFEKTNSAVNAGSRLAVAS